MKLKREIFSFLNHYFFMKLKKALISDLLQNDVQEIKKILENIKKAGQKLDENK